MERAGHNDVSFFIGTEVEHTPAFGKRTLFVVGVQDPQIVLQEFNNNDCEHIYFGANQSFPALDTNDGDGWRDWEWMIRTCLEHVPNYCTLDLDVNQAEGLLESSLVEFHNFIQILASQMTSVVHRFTYLLGTYERSHENFFCKII